jgi:ElaB/YqjD/DUF883 family membrane-anchored ribosome-binding protein
MGIYEEDRSSERIERDIENTRSRMAGTLNDIQRRFSSGQLVDQVLGYLDEKSGRVGSQITNTLKENPVPATLTGVGLIWLLTAGWTTAGTQDSSRRGYSEGSRGSGAVGRGFTAGTGGYRTGSSSGSDLGGSEETFVERRFGGERRHNGEGSSLGAWGGAEGQVERRQSERRTSAGQAWHAAGEALESMGQKASDTAGQVRERTGQVLGQAREKAQELTGEARERAQRAGRKVKEQTRHLFEEQPLVLGALGIAVGAALGASLPRTRQEDEWLGETRDEVMHRADEVGGEWLRETREQVKSGLESRTSEQPPAEPDRPDIERAESSPITAGSSSGIILAEEERERQPGSTETTGLESPSGGLAEVTTADTPATGERILTTPESGGEIQRP